MTILTGNLILIIWRHNNVNYVIKSIKLYVDVGHSEYIILCNFGASIMSGFKGIGGGPPDSPPPARHRSFKKKLGRIRVSLFPGLLYSNLAS